MVGSAVGAALGTLVVGAILPALFEGRTDRATAAVAEAPVGRLGSGLVLLVGVVGLVVLLAVSILGLVLVIPLVVVAYLARAAVIAGGPTLTAVGGLRSVVAGAVGVGALWRTR